MTLKAPGMLVASANIQYLCVLVCVEALRQYVMLSNDIGNTTSEHLN